MEATELPGGAGEARGRRRDGQTGAGTDATGAAA